MFFDIFGFIKNRINSTINFYYVIISFVNKLIDCFSKIKIDIKDVFAAPLTPLEQAKKNIDDLNKKNQEAMKKTQDDFNKIFHIPPPPPLPKLPTL
ncbi:hypothetical protein WA026_007369 [Henosepilachna vigintioctopunctata]|uniref:Uncharacterized protein n=1 Tax=Henosepilachna vigintioctopunctata TaxID=420089 RepID=A0AAW1UVN3_9CUCU